MNVKKMIENLKNGIGQDAYYYSDYEKEELQAKYDGRASFYKKAYVIYMNKNIILLQSYSTIVACVLNGKYIEFGKYSQTTTRHQREFEKQFTN